MEIGTHEGGNGPSAGAATHDIKEKASELTRTARHRAMSSIEDQKRQAAELLDKVAGTIEHDRLGSYAADYARRGAQFLRERSTNDIISSARSQLRARPGLVLSACFAGGLAIARLLRVEREDREQTGRERDESSEWRGPSTWEPEP